MTHTLLMSSYLDLFYTTILLPDGELTLSMYFSFCNNCKKESRGVIDVLWPSEGPHPTEATMEWYNRLSNLKKDRYWLVRKVGEQSEEVLQMLNKNDKVPWIPLHTSEDCLFPKIVINRLPFQKLILPRVCK